MPKKGQYKYNYEELKEIAQKYDDLKEFRTKEPKIYDIINNRKLRKELCSHMERKTRMPYTYEELKAIASRYDVLAEFRKQEPKAYDAIISHGAKELLGHMKNGKRAAYTYEELTEVTQRYDNLMEFRTKEPRIYDAINSRGLQEKLYGHMEREVRKSFTYEELKEIASRYDDRSEFIEKENSAYGAIIRLGLLEELCGHMKKKVERIPDEELAEVANGYDDLTRFKREQPRIYSAIVRRGLIGELCGHMNRNMRPDYTDEELIEIASRYNNLTKFRKEQRYPYFAIVRRGKLDEYCGHMERYYHPDYTDEELRDIASKYKTKSEFNKNDGAAYQAAHKHGILDEVCSHMEELRRPKWFRSKGYCHVIALGYKTRVAFQKGNPGAYQRAFAKGWLDDICNHMEVAGNLKRRLIYVYTFADGYAYVGLTDDVKRRKNEHLHKYVNKKISPVYQHHHDTGASYEYKELTGWLDADTVAKMEDEYIKQYKADGWKMLNRVKGGALGATTGVHLTDKRIRDTVSRYEYVEDFRDGEPKVYGHLCRKREFSKYCSGLKRRKKPRGYWNLERAIAVIPECETRNILEERYRQAYNLVKSAGLLDEYYPDKPEPHNKLSLEDCANAARYCETKTEFRKKHHRAYERLKKEGLLDEMFEDTERREIQRTYTDEERIEILKRCENRTELRGISVGIYNWAKKNGLIDVYLPKKKGG